LALESITDFGDDHIIWAEALVVICLTLFSFPNHIMDGITDTDIRLRKFPNLILLGLSIILGYIYLEGRMLWPSCCTHVDNELLDS
jgi:hypothetical protein